MTALHSFNDFCTQLLDAGFSLGGGNPKGIYAVVPFSWENQDRFDSPVRWHTGDPETDPWEWRMRVLEERADIAYAKVFFKTSGFISEAWYSDFLAVRRHGETIRQAYAAGTVSRTAKKIYDLVSEYGIIPYHEIKRAGGFSKEDNSSFERAIVDLQMRMFLTISGRTQKKDKDGKSYGWNSTDFSTVENFWEMRGVTLRYPSPDDAGKRIREKILTLNPDAVNRTVEKFIRG